MDSSLIQVVSSRGAIRMFPHRDLFLQVLIRHGMLYVPMATVRVLLRGFGMIIVTGRDGDGELYGFIILGPGGPLFDRRRGSP